jgi:hypothetical protein
VGALQISADGRGANLKLPAAAGGETAAQSATFTLVLALAGAFSAKSASLVASRRSSPRDLELEYGNGARLMVDVDEGADPDLDFYKFRWTRPAQSGDDEDQLPAIWVCFFS